MASGVVASLNSPEVIVKIRRLGVNSQLYEGNFPGTLRSLIVVALVPESGLGDVDSVPDRCSVSGMTGPVVISGGDPFVAVGSFSGWIVPLTASDVDAVDAGSGTAASTPLPSCIEVSVVIVFSRPVPLSATL